MGSHVGSPRERRVHARRPEALDALVGRKRWSTDRCEHAVIENVSRGGVRLRSGLPVKRDETVVVFTGRRAHRAKVVWVRKEGLIRTRSSKLGSAFLAGCRLKDEEPAKAAGARVAHGLAFRVACLAAALALGGLVLYAIASLLSMLAVL